MLLVNIKKLISYAIQKSRLNNFFFVVNKPNKNGKTTIVLFEGLIVMQMKGSGAGAEYHNLLFKINGAKIRKLININLI